MDKIPKDKNEMMSYYFRAMKLLLVEWEGFRDDIREVLDGLQAIALFVIRITIRIVLILLLPFSSILMGYVLFKKEEAEERQRKRMRDEWFGGKHDT